MALDSDDLNELHTMFTHFLRSEHSMSGAAWVYFAALLEAVTDTHATVTDLQQKVNTIMATLDDLKAQADKLKEDEVSEAAKIDALVGVVTAAQQQIKDLSDQLAAAIANGSDPAKVQAIADDLSAVSATMADSVSKLDAANPPAPPAP